MKYVCYKTIALMGSEKSSEADESTLARKAAKYGRRCPYRKPTQVDEKKILRRTGNSSWRIATATDQVGRSRTLNFVHFSEVAFYECDLANLQAGIG